MPVAVLALAGYSGAPRPTPGSLWTSLTFDPLVAALVVLAGGAYLLGLRRVGRAWPVGRTVCFFGGGLGSLLLVTMGWVGVYAHELLWVYTVQITVLLIVTPALLAFGRPLTLAQATLPAAAVARIRSVLRSRPGRLLSSPVITPLLIPLVTVAVFFTGCVQATLKHYALYELLHLGLLGFGFLFALPLAGEEDEGSSLSLGAGVFIGLLELLLDAFPGIVLRLQTHLVAPAYFAALHRPWGPAPLHDQHTAGGVLWFLGESLDLPFLIILVLRWIKADEREAARVDRELDVVHAAIEAVSAGQPAAEIEAELSRPWWEDNPEVFGDRRAAGFRAEARRRGQIPRERR